MSSLPAYYRMLEIPVDGIYLDYFANKHQLDEDALTTLFAQACHKALVGYEDDELGHMLTVPVSASQYLALQEWDGETLESEKGTREHAIEAARAIIARECGAD